VRRIKGKDMSKKIREPMENAYTPETPLWYLCSEVVFIVIFALLLPFALAAPIETYVSRPFRVSGESMLSAFNNYEENFNGDTEDDKSDFVYTTRLTIIRRGDIIVFDQDGDILIKRVIGVGGDTISFTEVAPNKLRLVRNGEVVTEEYLDPAYRDGFIPSRMPDGALGQAGSVTVVPKGAYFVMGDNRGMTRDGRGHGSRDSRYFGCIGRELVLGKVYLTVRPGENWLQALFGSIF
jgi:signal peptidase I